MADDGALENAVNAAYFTYPLPSDPSPVESWIPTVILAQFESDSPVTPLAQGSMGNTELHRRI